MMKSPSKLLSPPQLAFKKLIFVKLLNIFSTNGVNASRYQYPIQNAFALTIHKAQGLTLPSVCLELDETIFAPGQAYVAIGRTKRLSDISISSFHPEFAT